MMMTGSWEYEAENLLRDCWDLSFCVQSTAISHEFAAMIFKKPLLSLWYELDLLPGYLIYPHEKNNHTLAKLILRKKNAYNNQPDIEKLDFFVTRTMRFTLVPKKHLEILQASSKNGIVIASNNEYFDTRTQAKLCYELEGIKKRLKKRDTGLLKIITSEAYQQTTQSLFKEHSQNLLVKAPSAHFKNIRKKLTPRSYILPFSYYGNSSSRIPFLHLILEHSPQFQEAKVIKETTCGSCCISIFLAQKYPQKQFIATDINPFLINALNYIKNTDMQTIEEQYVFYHKKILEAPKKQQETLYKSLIKQFNESTEKDYILFIFLQNNAVGGNLFFCANSDQLRARSIKINPSKSTKSHLINIRDFKEVLSQSNFIFQTQSLEEAIKESQPGDFYIATPPFQNSQKEMYVNSLSVDEIIASFKLLQENKTPYIICHDDNRDSSIHNNLDTYLFPYTIYTTKAKKLVIYVAKNAMEVDGANKIAQFLYKDAHKLKRRANKELLKLVKEPDSEKIIEAKSQQQRQYTLSEEILADISCEPSAEIQIEERFIREITENNLITGSKRKPIITMSPSQFFVSKRQRIEPVEDSEITLSI